MLDGDGAGGVLEVGAGVDVVGAGELGVGVAVVVVGAGVVGSGVVGSGAGVVTVGSGVVGVGSGVVSVAVGVGTGVVVGGVVVGGVVGPHGPTFPERCSENAGLRLLVWIVADHLCTFPSCGTDIVTVAPQVNVSGFCPFPSNRTLIVFVSFSE